MVQAVNVQQVQGFPNIGGRAFFTGMREQLQALAARGSEHPGELCRRMTKLGGVQPHAQQAAEERLGGSERREGRRFVEVPQEAEDEVDA